MTTPGGYQGEATLPLDATKDAEDLKTAEDQVPEEWNTDDVILDTYEVRKLSEDQDYAQGGLGRVYRVHHRGWNKDLAVKSPRMEHFKTEEEKANFIAECEAWIELGLHPNIVSCHYVRVLGKIPRVFAEFVEGGSLADWITDKRLYRDGPAEALKRILDISIQFAWGLHCAHEKGLIHQDVKPDNVMMTADGATKVTDFGLARARAVTVYGGDAADADLAVTYRGLTSAYCSPEQAAACAIDQDESPGGHRPKLTRKTDIWSWAVSVLDMFYGKVHRGAGQAAMELLETYLQTGANDESIPPMPDALGDLLEHCFQQDPDERPKDMAEIAGRLKDIYREVTGQAYLREEPKAAELLADGLNNKALSYLDLNKKEEAEKLFNDALAADPHHPEATYNRGLLHWRAARITDDELVRQLEEVCESHPDDWRDDFLLGLVHLERGDAAAATDALSAAKESGADSRDVFEAFATVEALQTDGTNSIQVFEDSAGPLTFASDGSHVVFGRVPRIWDLVRNELVSILDGHSGDVTACEISSELGIVVTGGEDNHIRTWKEGKEIRCTEWRSDQIAALTIDEDRMLCRALGAKGSFCAWDLKTLTCVEEKVAGPLDFGRLVGRSADGEFAFSATEKDAVYDQASFAVWDVASGKMVNYLGRGISVAMSSDRLIVFAQNSVGIMPIPEEKHYAIEIVGVGNDRPHPTRLVGHQSQVRCVALSSDGQHALSGSGFEVEQYAGEHSVRLWDMRTGQCIRVFEGHTSAVIYVGFCAGDKCALSASSDGLMRIWDLKSGQCIRTDRFNGKDLRSGTSSPQGRFVILDDHDGSRELWRIGSGIRQKFQLCRPMELAVHQSIVTKFITAKKYARTKLEGDQPQEAFAVIKAAMGQPGYERNSELLSMRREAGGKGQVRGFCAAWSRGRLPNSAVLGFCQRGRLLALLERNSIKLVNAHSGAVYRELPASSYVDCLWSATFSLRGCLFFAEHNGLVCFLSNQPGVFGHIRLADGRVLDEHKWCRAVSTTAGRDFVSCAAFSRDGKWVVVGSFSIGGNRGELVVWDATTGRPLARLECVGSLRSMRSVAISRDGQQILAGTAEGWLVFATPSERENHLDVHPARERDESGELGAIDISPDNQYALVGVGSVLQLWQLSERRCVMKWDGHAAIKSVAFTCGGRFAISVGGDGAVRLWDVRDGMCLRVMQTDKGGVRKAVISSDGCIMATSSDWGTNIWDIVWDYEYPKGVDWDEKVRPYLATFLTLHCRYGDDGFNRVGKPAWNDEDFQHLVMDLQYYGYGWLRPEAVRNKLEEMTATWTGPPPLPWKESPDGITLPGTARGKSFGHGARPDRMASKPRVGIAPPVPKVRHAKHDDTSHPFNQFGDIEPHDADDIDLDILRQAIRRVTADRSLVAGLMAGRDRGELMKEQVVKIRRFYLDAMHGKGHCPTLNRIVEAIERLGDDSHGHNVKDRPSAVSGTDRFCPKPERVSHVKCCACHAENPPNQDFCTQCGKPIHSD